MNFRSRSQRFALAALGCACLSLPACDLFGGGGGGASAAPSDAPAKPNYEGAFEELADLPHQLGLQVAWAAQPIEDAGQIANEIANLQANLHLDGEAFKGMFKAALTEGRIEISGDLSLGEAQAEVEASLAKIKKVAADLKGMPGRVKMAGKTMAQLAASSPKLALKATMQIKGELKTAVGDQKISLQANLVTIKELPKEVKAELGKAKQIVAALPAKAVKATKNLVLAIDGKPIDPVEPVPGAEPGVTPPAGGPDTLTAKPPVTPPAPSVDGEVAPPTAAFDEPTAPPAPTGDAGVAPPTAAFDEPDAAIPVAPPAGVSVDGATDAAPPSGANASEAAVAARVKELKTIARAAGKLGDWLTAADAYEEAYVLLPTDLELAYLTGDAAARAKDCERAQIYIVRYLEYGPGAAGEGNKAPAAKTLGELKAFECPARGEEELALHAQTIALRAKQLGDDGDWSGAAAGYAMAYQAAPKEHIYAYRVAVSSWNANECGDAVSYFQHFTTVADARKQRSKIREAKKYIERNGAGECTAWDPADKDAHARELYAQGQALEDKLDFTGAVGKYERAYHLLPTNHALAWRMAATEWKATHCEPATKYARVFVEKADPNDARYAGDLPKAQAIAKRVDDYGCPDALWATGPKTGGSAGSGGAGGDEKPPPVAKSGCAVAPDQGGGGALALGLLVLGAGLRRRRRWA